MKKIDNLTTVIVFSLFLLLLGAGGWVLKDKAFSANENRVLQQRPAVTAEALLSGEFEEAFQKYQDDQFPFRDSWITLKTATKLALLSKDLNGVYLGKDGYLIEKISDEDADQELFASNLQAVKAFCEKLPTGLSKSVILVPTTAAIMKEKLPAGAAPFEEGAYAKAAARQLQSVNYVDLYDEFGKKKDRALYYRTDHHWTTEGAMLAYDVWKQSMGQSGISLKQLHKRLLSDDFQGSLYSKVLWDDGTRDQVTAYIGERQMHSRVIADGQTLGGMYQEQFLREKDKYAVFFGGNYGSVEVDTGNQNGKHLLIIKDSFANAFAPFAAEDFDKVFLVDLRYFSGNLLDYVEEHHITDVLILYSMSNMIKDKNISALKSGGNILS